MLRGLDADVNDVIAAAVDVRGVYVDAADAATVAGLVRSLSVAPPPTPDGRLRIIDIDGIDRQACGGTHLSNTGTVAPVPHHQGREQGQAQPPHPLRPRVAPDLGAQVPEIANVRAQKVVWERARPDGGVTRGGRRGAGRVPTAPIVR